MNIQISIRISRIQSIHGNIMTRFAWCHDITQILRLVKNNRLHLFSWFTLIILERISFWGTYFCQLASSSLKWTLQSAVASQKLNSAKYCITFWKTKSTRFFEIFELFNIEADKMKIRSRLQAISLNRVYLFFRSTHLFPMHPSSTL